MPTMKATHDYLSPNSPLFQYWILTAQSSDRPIAIGSVKHQFSDLIHAKTSTLLISGDTAIKQRTHHPELTANDYALLTNMNHADAVFIEGSSELVFFYVSQTLYKAAIKRTKSGNAIFLTSFHIAKRQYLEGKRKKATVVFDHIE